MTDLIVLNYTVIDEITPRINKASRNKAIKLVNRKAGEYWLQNIMPRHFTSANRRYNYQRRTEIYRKIIKPAEGVGQGRFADLNLKGRSFREAKVFSRVTSTSRTGVITVEVPAYFVRPALGRIPRDRSDPSKGFVTVTQQPDKVAEVKQTTPAEVRELDRYATDCYSQALAAFRAVKKFKIG